jgi:hypothetical protein
MATLNFWNNGASKQAIETFVARVTDADSADFVPPAARIAVFDNDGTLWPEKPMPVELGFILRRLSEMARDDATLREQQPWKAAATKDYAWLGEALTKHYSGDDGDVSRLVAAVLKAFEGLDVETYEARALAYFRQATHPVINRPIVDCGYAPMIELLRFLEANGFVNYIASAGDRDFMRVITQQMYGIPEERVIGSSHALCYTETPEGGSVAFLAKPDVFDDGAAKPVRIWSRIGRRPILAVGNSNGDIQMLQYAGGHGPALRALLVHDDKERESDYVAGSEKALELARANHWTLISLKNDWKCVFH